MIAKEPKIVREGFMNVWHIMVGVEQTPISLLGSKITKTPRMIPMMPSWNKLLLRRETAIRAPNANSGTPTAISATPVQWHFIETWAPVLVVKYFP